MPSPSERGDVVVVLRVTSKRRSRTDEWRARETVFILAEAEGDRSGVGRREREKSESASRHYTRPPRARVVSAAAFRPIRYATVHSTSAERGVGETFACVCVCVLMCILETWRREFSNYSVYRVRGGCSAERRRVRKAAI